jgi:hypothetical protein
MTCISLNLRHILDLVPLSIKVEVIRFINFLRLLLGSSVSEGVEACYCSFILRFKYYHLFLSAFFCFLIASISVSAILVAQNV